MFALELLFNDGISPDELIFVRRQSFVFGSIQDADVILEGTSGAISPVRIERRRGRRFAAIPLEDGGMPQIYTGEGEIKVGEITLRIIPIDTDILSTAISHFDSVPIGILTKALCNKPPEYPALEVIGSTNCVISFPEGEEVLIGKSRNCIVRLDEDGISQEHARVGSYSSDKSLSEFWLEPIPGAACYQDTDKPLTGRTDFSAGQTVVLSPGKCSIRFLLQEEVHSSPSDKTKKPSLALSRYPCIVSRSELMKPDRYPLSIGRRISLGRDPSNEIWFNAEHVSRLHAEILLEASPIQDSKNNVNITDFSSNGTFIDGARLPAELKRTIPDKLTVVDLSRGITFAICFNAEEEEEYLGRKPKPQRRGSSLHGQILSQIQIPLTPFNSDEEDYAVTERPSWFSSSELKSEKKDFSGFNSSQSEAFTPLASSDSSGISFSQRDNFFAPEESARSEVGEEESQIVDEFAPVKRFGLWGKVMFWGAFLVLAVVNYFVYLGQ